MFLGCHFGGQILPAVDPVSEMSGITSRGGPVHQPRLPHLLHEEEAPDRSHRAGQSHPEVRAAPVVIKKNLSKILVVFFLAPI